jgi:uncharacterized membrane protein YgcG
MPQSKRYRGGQVFEPQGKAPHLFPIVILVFAIIYPFFAKITKRNPLLRGLFGASALGVFAFLVITTAFAGILVFLFIGFLTGVLGLGNTLLLLAHTHGRGGRMGGGFGRGGGWSGGGGGFSGGGATGRW